MKFERADVERYEDSVTLAIESRSTLGVTGISTSERQMTISLDATPSSSQLNEIDDILAATERYRATTNGSDVTYELQDTDPTDSTIPDTHMAYEERISQIIGDEGSLGKNVGGVAPADVSPTINGSEITVSLPDGATTEAKDRTREAMLAFGRVEVTQ